MNTPGDLAVDTNPGDSRAVVITVTGELDHETADPLHAALLDAAMSGDLVLDTSGLTFCDSSGLRAVIEAHRQASDHGHTLRLAATSPKLLRVLDLTGVLAVITVYPDVESALKAADQ